MNLPNIALIPILVAATFVRTAMAAPPTGSSRLQAGQPQAELQRGPENQRQIALTFDAGGSDEELPTLLRILSNENIVCTFFLTGKWASEYPSSASQIVDRGHVIGSHTWGHKDLTKLTDSEIVQEILRADDRFVSWFGCRYQPILRAPFGETDARVLAVVEKLGFRAVRWSIDTLDSIEPRKTASFIEDRVLGRSDEELCGAIVLMHVGYEETCEALPVIIHNLRERGFEFVPVSSWISKPQPVLTSFRLGTLMNLAEGSEAALKNSTIPIPRTNREQARSLDDQLAMVRSRASSSTPAKYRISEAWDRWTKFSKDN